MAPPTNVPLTQIFNVLTFLLDSLSLSFSSIQVETVGDKYMAVSGLPDHCEDHAKCMARVALDMMDMAQNVKMGSNPVVSLASIVIFHFFTAVGLNLLG